MDPFPGNMSQILIAKFQDETPEIPLEFPAALKNLISYGWSKKPRERPELEKFRLALSVMLREEENQSLTLTDETKMASFPVVFKGEYH
jgi:hypothetical protein